MRTRSVSRWIPLACVAAASAMVFGPASAAHAVDWGCSLSSHVFNPDDSGGEGASAFLYEWGNSTRNAIASFNPYGEVLAVEDQRQDGLLATAQVLVYNFSGTLVDVDNLSTGKSYETFNIGTPDGSGDIPEGYTVKLNISIGNQTCGTAVGRA